MSFPPSHAYISSHGLDPQQWLASASRLCISISSWLQAGASQRLGHCNTHQCLHRQNQPKSAPLSWDNHAHACPLFVCAGGTEGRSAVAALLKIINAQPAKSKKGPGGRGQQQQQQQGEEEEGDSEDEDQEGAEERGGSGRRGRKGGTRRPLRPLMRPIICICNDLYTPALRPLREVAKIFHFRKPQVRWGQNANC